MRLYRWFGVKIDSRSLRESLMMSNDEFVW